ncbi:MAG: hypothetical protein MMC33_007487 [Icmadophila ericetorum]|nr:hypothetical protein [Icmadophila ericetorum]
MAVFPPPPVANVVNGHIESTYSDETKEWSPPKFVASPYLQVHGLCSGLNYGMQTFEGMKAFRTPSNRIALFRPQENAARLRRSTAFLGIPEISQKHIVECVHLAVGVNAEYVPPLGTGAALYVRPLIFGSAAQVMLNPPKEYTFCVYVTPTGTYHGSRPLSALILEDLDRAAPEGTGSYKIGGNYAPVFNFAKKARTEGFEITLHLDSKTRSEIDEFTTSGFIGVKVNGENVTLVVPDSKSALKSITSESACEIAATFGWAVERRRVPYEELASFTEVIAAGTAAALVPIKSISMRSKQEKLLYRCGSDDPGPTVTRLLKTLQGIQMGTVQDMFGWLEYVESPGNLLGGQVKDVPEIGRQARAQL